MNYEKGLIVKFLKMFFFSLYFTQGCTVYPENDPRKRIYTVDSNQNNAMYMTSDKPQCMPKYRDFLIWRNSTWESYPYEGIVGAAYKGIPDASGIVVQQLGLVVIIILKIYKLKKLLFRLT